MRTINSAAFGGNVLDVYGGGASAGVYREVSLGGATAATLYFDDRRRALDLATDYVTVSASADGGGTWTELLPRALAGPTNDILVQSTSYDLTPYISDRTRIRFQAAATLGPADHVEIDNVRVEFSGAGACFVTTNYRSIGAGKATPDSTGTVTATRGSTAVTGSGGQQWLGGTVRRGRGDVISIAGVPYTVAAVTSNTALTLTTPYLGTSGPKAYVLDRQFATLGTWENCVDRSANGGSCAPFALGTPSLVADNRAEVGIAYHDAVFFLGPSGENAPLTFQDSATDAGHTITLTADGSSRHRGVPGAGVRIDGERTVNGIRIYDTNVTVEWVEVTRVSGAGPAAGIAIGNDGSERNILVQNVLVHDFFDASNPTAGIRLRGAAGKVVTLRNAMVWNGDDYVGIEGDEATDTLTIEDCSVDGIPAPGEPIDAMETPNVVVRNTIAISAGGQAAFAATAGGSDAAASASNTSSDTTAPGTSPHTNVTAASVVVAPNSDLHLKRGANTEVDSGQPLAVGPAIDVDGEPRPFGAAWDRGADESLALVEVGGGCTGGTEPVGPNKVLNGDFGTGAGDCATWRVPGPECAVPAQVQFTSDLVTVRDGYVSPGVWVAANDLMPEDGSFGLQQPGSAIRRPSRPEGPRRRSPCRSGTPPRPSTSWATSSASPRWASRSAPCRRRCAFCRSRRDPTRPAWRSSG